MKIAIVSPGWPRASFSNGIVSAIAEIIDPLRARGAEVQVLALSGDGSWSDPSVVRAPRPRATGLGHRLSRWARNALDQDGALSRLIAGQVCEALQRNPESARPDVVDIEESHGAAVEIARCVDVALVVGLHGPWFLHGPFWEVGTRRAKLLPRIRAEGQALRAADLIVAPAQDVLRRTCRYYGLRPDNALVIPYAISPKPVADRWCLDRCDPDEMVFVGRFDRHKGGDLVLDAFALVRERRPRARLVFVGPDKGLRDDHGRHWTLDQYAAARLPGATDTGHLHLVGQAPTQRVERHRQHALATLSCSRWENLSLAVLEAMSAGCPTIVADAGGLPEHVHDGRTGRVFRAGDVRDLARVMVEILDDPAGAARLGRNALTHVETHLAPQQIARRRLDAYDLAIERHRQSRGNRSSRLH